MRKNNGFDINKLEYSTKRSILLIQLICCVLIVLVILLIKFLNQNLVEQVNYYLHHHTDWQIVYDILLKTKDIILHYIR